MEYRYNRTKVTSPEPEEDESISAPRVGLLGIPVELREQVYAELLDSSSSSDLCRLLRTCRQIYDEARRFLYKRPLIFASQNAFFDWVDRVADRTLLCNIHTLKLKVVAPSAQSLEDFFLRRLHSADHHDPGETPESQDARQFISRLRLFSGLKHLAILRYTERDIEPKDEIIVSIFAFIRENMALSFDSLTLHDHKMPLTFLPDFQNLRTFNFTGFSVAEPEDALAKLSQLPKLEELILVGPPPELQFHQRTGCRGRRVVQSITPEVMASLRPLRALSLHELRDDMFPGLKFFTAEMLNAVRDKHARSLRHLSLQTNQFLAQQSLSPSGSSYYGFNNSSGTDVLRSIRSLLREAARSLETVSLAWYDLDADIFHFVLSSSSSSSLKHLEVSLPAHDTRRSHAIVSTLVQLQRLNCFPSLRSVVLKYYTARDPVSTPKGFMPTPSRATGQRTRPPLMDVEIEPALAAWLEMNRQQLRELGLRVDARRWELGYEDV